MAYKNVHQFMGSKTQAIVMTIVATVTVLTTGFGPFGPMVAGAQPASLSLSPMQDPLVEASRNPQLARALQDAYEAESVSRCFTTGLCSAPVGEAGARWLRT